MLSTVPLPMTRSGGAMATLGSLAVFNDRASAVTPGPGAIAPPRYSPAAETTSHVTAVPKSSTRQGPPCSANAATASHRRSAPSSLGASTSSGMSGPDPGLDEERRLGPDIV